MLTKNTEQLKQCVAEHVAADSIIQGIYWDSKNMRGCFIGCLAHDNDPAINEATYGLPVMVQRIAEYIFEALPADDSKAFFAALPDAVGYDGKDLSRVSWQFLADELRNLPEQTAETQAVIDPVIAGMDLLIAEQEWADTAAQAAARTAAGTAARTARAAARAAAYAARAAAQAADRTAVEAAAYAAHVATYSAEDAAYAAAQAADRTAVRAAAATNAAQAARLRQRDLLLRLISEAPVVESTNDH